MTLRLEEMRICELRFLQIRTSGANKDILATVRANDDRQKSLLRSEKARREKT